MRLIKRSLIFLLAILYVFSLYACGNGNGTAKPSLEPFIGSTPPTDFKDEVTDVPADPNKFMTISLMDEGNDIYAYKTGASWGYRYGPSMMLYADGSMGSWFASPGAAGLWDFFTYKTSTDGGATWGEDKVVLQPLPDTMEYPSVCDPGVVYFGGYYYIGYTSTVYQGGVSNNIFVARSKSPEGPYEKWNGSGWGGDNPVPIIYYTDDAASFGAGEPSFVELNGTLYIYYTWQTPSSLTTRVAVADATKENWPDTIEFKGVALNRNINPMEDSADVKYVEDYGKFLAITVSNRMSDNSGLQFWESNDGITFYRTSLLKTNVISCAHNAGLMGRPNGHINLSDKLYLAYAYGGSTNAWGLWSTRLQEFTLSLADSIDMSDAENENRKVPVVGWNYDETWTLGIVTKNLQHFERHISGGKFLIEILWFDSSYQEHQITDASKIKFYDYDETIIGFDGLSCIPKKVGDTYVTAQYDGVTHRFKVSILPDDATINSSMPELVEFKSAFIYPTEGFVKITKDGTVMLDNDNRRERIQIRALGKFDDGNWMELFNNQGLSARFWDGTHYKFNIKYSSSDENVVLVRDTGMITIRGVGTATVTVSCGNFSYDLKIVVQ